MEALPYQITGGRWLVTGPLPNDCQLIERNGQQIFTDAVGNPQPECFGVFWEAVGPETDTENCRDCDLEPLCRMATVHFRIPAALKGLGGPLGEHTAAALAPKLELNCEAVLALVGDWRALNEPAQGVQPKRPKRVPPAAGGEKAGPPEPGGGPPENPMCAPSAQIVAGGATQPATKILYARLAKVWDAHRRIWIRPWEARSQWQQERQANEWIRRLLPGMILRRSFAGQWWTVQVHSHAYQFQGRRYPTLTAITGEVFSQVPVRHRTQQQRTIHCPSHVARFWCLPKLLEVDRRKVAGVAETMLERLHNRFWRE